MPHKWYAIYTRSRYEKRVEKFLREKEVEVYLPLMRVFRRWSDRMKRVEVPLFNSYLFVRTHPSDQRHYYNILQTPGVVRFITFEGQPVPVPDHQIDALQRLSAEGYDLEPADKPLTPGTPVEIKQGPLKGIRGEVLSAGTNKFLIIQIDSLDKSIQVKIPPALVEPTKEV
ncbi:MAG: UpxY family transcription antiterminator [Bacteroidales bacterium]|jgi:transcription antitermination factor NusG|nr:UpxY family transcription antiterminator [Bacteroidales bacterium]NLM92315.1 UpxY family transcription antiterminator [Bacteroidales bacterium]